ncbi:hypothetical protein [Pusillimonas sp. ANT_WB101]|uniref:hypothetical protein n=1 Tax=Pusillimonas sp. ANT_WB101 TaxID=2597356 RepID=UPI0011F05729|nr:hypothetical protein [Pusillimonas sp. ANT_WB101]KAA0890234.1 hypothetical protein FQ179_18100 [Pusillimonas sp. ANT_WB101]
MQSTSRRAFLTGRRLAQTPWQAFCQSMRSIEGTFFEFDMPDGPGAARLVPAHASGVHQARLLCEKHGVVLALDDVQHAARLDDHPVLWVDPGRSLARCEPLEPGSKLWFVQPGCLLGELETAGFTQFADLPCHITVASWLADRVLCDWPVGQTHRSGLVHAAVMLSDGQTVNLGPFGENNRKPLEGARLQQLVPALFRLAAGEHVVSCRAAQRWPGRYRVDALLPVDGQTINLAHLLLGHGGDLGWVEWLVLDQQLLQPEPELLYAERYSSSRAVRDGLAGAAGDLDAGVKGLFDPEQRFPHPGQDL